YFPARRSSDLASGGVHDNRNSTAVHTAPDAVFFSFAVEVYKSRINAVTAQVEVEPESLRHHSRNTSTAGTQFKVFVEFRNVGADTATACAGFYAAGYVVDIDAATGCINLQFALRIAQIDRPATRVCCQLARIAVDLDAAARRTRFRVAADVFNTQTSSTGFKLLSASYTLKFNRPAAGVESARHL